MAIKRNMILGIVATFIVSVIAKYLSVWLPFLGGEAIAMLIGIVLGNTILRHEKFAPGMKWAEKYPIEIGIALMGLTVTLRTIENLGLNGIVFILIQMALTIVVVLWMGGRLFKVSDKSAMLMGAGNAVCGSSAIASVAPAIGANDDQRRTAVATVSLTGVVLLLLLPVIGPDGLGDPKLAEIAGNQNTSNVYYAAHFSTQAPATDAATPFVTAYKKTYGEAPSQFTALAYDAVYMIKQAIEDEKSVDRAKITTGLAHIKNFDGVTGKMTMDAFHNPKKSIVMVGVTDGKDTTAMVVK